MTTSTLRPASPFPFLSAEELRDLAAFFAGEPAALSVAIERDGVTLHVTPRDLAFIHSLDASRFGGSVKECPICKAEAAS